MAKLEYQRFSDLSSPSWVSLLDELFHRTSRLCFFQVLETTFRIQTPKYLIAFFKISRYATPLCHLNWSIWLGLIPSLDSCVFDPSMKFSVSILNEWLVWICWFDHLWCSWFCLIQIGFLYTLIKNEISSRLPIFFPLIWFNFLFENESFLLDWAPVTKWIWFWRSWVNVLWCMDNLIFCVCDDLLWLQSYREF